MKKVIISIIIVIILIVIISILIFMYMRGGSVKTIDSIKELEYRISDGRSMNASIYYDLKCDDKCILTSKLYGYPEDKVFEVELSDEDISNIIKLLQDNNVVKWDGFNGSARGVLDGTSFYFKVVTKDNVIIDASGYMKYPRNYKTVIDELEKIFDKANDKERFLLFDHEYYKGFDINNVTKVIEEFYGEGGLEKKEYTEQSEIQNFYERFKRYKLGLESDMACDDNTQIFRFIMKDGKEYKIEIECSDIVIINNKRYLFNYA